MTIGLTFDDSIVATQTATQAAFGFFLIFFIFVGFPLFVVGGLLWARNSAKRQEREAKKVPVQLPQRNTSCLTPPVASPAPLVAISRQVFFGPMLEEVTGKSAKGHLKDCEMMKEFLKTLDPIEADVVKMVQAGATLADIKRRHGKEVADRAQEIKDKARAELAEKIRPMVVAGMTMEDIIAQMNADISQANSPDLDPDTTWIPHSAEGQQMPAAQHDKPATRRNTRTSSEPTARSIVDPSPAPEGRRRPRTNYTVVRSAKLRKAAIEIHGRNCCACRRNFDEMYGPELAKGYIEIHHLNRIAAGKRTTDPVTDLAPLCSNCHTMADRLSPPPRTIAELRYQLFPEFRLQEKEIAPAAGAKKSPVKIRIGKIREKKPKKDS